MNDDKLHLEYRSSVRSVLEVLDIFRALSVTMPIGEVIMFLTVSMAEGSSLGELADIAGIKKSSASRYLLDLSDKTRVGGEGYGLVVRVSDPAELRRNMYTLSPRGRHLVNQLTQRQRKTGEG